MYADRYAKPTLKPGSLGVALAINGAVIGALLLAAPEVLHPPERPFEAVNIALPPPPAPPPKPQTHPKAAHPIAAPKRNAAEQATVKTAPLGPVFDSHPGFDPGPAASDEGRDTVVDPPRPQPIIVGPALDRRFASAFQPTYPAEERRAGNAGRVLVRVLVGVDGRVKQIERVAAPSDAFYEATRRRALDKWRFRPATRDGVAVEQWFTIGVSFVLDD